ncbi:hypothetical protein [Escherichia coli]|uniref:hypothetical protein n=1 Tax=Escherichia coli TaxID=562 RepID=UPI003B66CDA7
MVAVTPAVWLVTLISTVPSGSVITVATVAPLSAITHRLSIQRVFAIAPSVSPAAVPGDYQISDLRRPDIGDKRHVPSAQAAVVDTAL